MAFPLPDPSCFNEEEEARGVRSPDHREQKRNSHNIPYKTIQTERNTSTRHKLHACLASHLPISFSLPTQTKESKSRNDKYLVKPFYLTIEAKKNYHALILLEHSISPQLYYSIITSPILFLPPHSLLRKKKNK